MFPTTKIGEESNEPCANFVCDRSRTHWENEVAGAPEDGVEFLTNLGQAVVNALPALEIALDHPNKWNFVPAVVKAIAKIGQADSIEVLQKASQSERSELRMLVKSNYAFQVVFRPPFA
jgi:hypothetical protein